MKSTAVILNGLGLYLLALGLMMISTPAGVSRDPVQTLTAQGLPCLGDRWAPAQEPKAVMLIGHGVTSNRAVMATLAKTFAANGYETVAFDFFGHGRSRERFIWGETHTQVAAWVEWARMTHPGLPVAYLGHSMGGVAGFAALGAMDSEIPFVSLGMLPRGGALPPGPILLALGQFEQLFTPAQAQARADQAEEGHVSVLVSPWSDHSFEPLDPVLVGGIVDWVDGALGFPQDSTFPWGRWLMALIAVPLGMIGNLTLALGITGYLQRPPQEGPTRLTQRKWSVNPYRLTGRLLGQRGQAARPISGSFAQAIPLGLLFGAICVVTLSILLTNDMFVSRIDHPHRLLRWILFIPIFAVPFLIDAYAVESVPHRNPWRRFLVTALTRVVPILTLSLLMQLPGTGVAFLGMMIGIFAFLGFMMAVVHTIATLATNDYRSGAIASATIFAWVVAFWFPLTV